MRKGFAAVALFALLATAGVAALLALWPSSTQGPGPAFIPVSRAAAPVSSLADRGAARGHMNALLIRPTVLWARPGQDPLIRLSPRTEFGSPRVLAVVRRRGDWLGVIATERPNGRLGWIRRSVVWLGREPYSVRIDLSQRALTLRRAGRVVQRVPIAIGQASTPTPVGRFAVTDALSVVNPSSPYGCCAIALSAHQPHIATGWRGGDRVAIHATTNEFSIGRAVSHGCLRASQYYMRKLIREVPLGTPVRIIA